MSGKLLKRDSSIELLRIFAIILILIAHTVNYARNNGPAFSEFNVFVCHILSAIGGIGVPVFVLISGYYSVNFKKHRFVQIALLSILYPILLYFLGSNQYQISSILKLLLALFKYDNWYISCYLLLMLISPFLNQFLGQLSKSDYRKLLIILFVTLSVLPTFFRSCWNSAICTDAGKCFTNFLFVYILGRYMKLYEIKVNNRIKLILCWIAISGFILLCNWIVSRHLGYFSTSFSFDCSPFIILSSVIVFLLFKELTFSSRVVNWFAQSVLAVYLLDGARSIVDKPFSISQYNQDASFVIWVIVEVFIGFLLSVVIDKMRVLTEMGFTKLTSCLKIKK